ncbi:DUF3892 domain-containing protein [Clostridium novyi]
MSETTESFAIFEVAYEDNDTNKRIIEVNTYYNGYGDLMWKKKEFKFSTDEVISKIENGTGEFITIVEDSLGKYKEGSKVIVYESNGIKYIKTESNGEKNDNLSDLPVYEI